MQDTSVDHQPLATLFSCCSFFSPRPCVSARCPIPLLFSAPQADFDRLDGSITPHGSTEVLYPHHPRFFSFSHPAPPFGQPADLAAPLRPPIPLLNLRKKTRFKEDEFYKNIKRSKFHSTTSCIGIVGFRSSPPGGVKLPAGSKKESPGCEPRRTKHRWYPGIESNRGLFPIKNAKRKTAVAYWMSLLYPEITIQSSPTP
jgi:hypothetical protein